MVLGYFPPSLGGIVHIVEPDGRLLSDLATDFASPFQTWGGEVHNLEVHLDQEAPVIGFGEHEVPATTAGVAALLIKNCTLVALVCVMP